MSKCDKYKITSGTKEWADTNVNCYFGCSNDCRYCYAKKMAIRFKRKTENNWKVMIPNEKVIVKNYKKRHGRVMFPSSHDITPKSLDNCIIVLKRLLKAENEVLITTKPNYSCIKKICDSFTEYKSLIQFRFTITSLNNELLKFWEPNAPSYEERLESLKYAYHAGFKTSVSIEPFLDKNPIPLIRQLSPYVSESIWLGKMNYIRRNSFQGKDKKYYDLIRENYGIENINLLLNEIEQITDCRINLKDSIKILLSRYYKDKSINYFNKAIKPISRYS